MVVDPAHEGKGRLTRSYSVLRLTDTKYLPGLCKLLMKDGFKRTFPKPIHLEVSSKKNREIWEHFGFEVC